ncbi:hypothetical protein [Azospirillum sp. SYSU D00513]|uniref:hypothetical protein n=1 Tax=Azospirillum sp. SYSU D00513 TaxID=2812561 RepID=UPI001A968DD9|nr:hypothetical protein [Azospirillum sp. SYSU D00513]
MTDQYDICIDPVGQGWVVFDAWEWRHTGVFRVLKRDLTYEQARNYADLLNTVGTAPGKGST